MDSYSFEYKGSKYEVSRSPGLTLFEMFGGPSSYQHFQAACAEILRLADQHETDARLGRELCAILQNHVTTGPDGRGEGAVEVLRRIIDERQTLTNTVNLYRAVLKPLEREQRDGETLQDTLARIIRERDGFKLNLRGVLATNEIVERENREKCLELAEMAGEIRELQAQLEAAQEALARGARKLTAAEYRRALLRAASGVPDDTPEVANFHREISGLNRRLADKIERLAKLRVERDEVEREKDAAHRQLAAQKEVEGELRKLVTNDARRLLALLDSEEPPKEMLLIVEPGSAFKSVREVWRWLREQVADHVPPVGPEG